MHPKLHLLKMGSKTGLITTNRPGKKSLINAPVAKIHADRDRTKYRMVVSFSKTVVFLIKYIQYQYSAFQGSSLITEFFVKFPFYQDIGDEQSIEKLQVPSLNYYSYIDDV